MYYKQPLFHHESWFKTTALGHKNQLLTTSSGTTIPSVFPSNVDSMINIHPVSSLIISARSLLCIFLLTGVLCAQQLAGKTQRAELLHTKLHREKATSVQCVSSKRALKMQFFPQSQKKGGKFSLCEMGPHYNPQLPLYSSAWTVMAHSDLEQE